MLIAEMSASVMYKTTNHVFLHYIVYHLIKAHELI